MYASCMLAVDNLTRLVSAKSAHMMQLDVFCFVFSVFHTGLIQCKASGDWSSMLARTYGKSCTDTSRTLVRVLMDS